jgi:hypothetical protein
VVAKRVVVQALDSFSKAISKGVFPFWSW